MFGEAFPQISDSFPADALAILLNIEFALHPNLIDRACRFCLQG